MLEDGGLLINFGPLMYHWSGHGDLIPSDITESGHGINNGSNSQYQLRNRHLDQRYLANIDYTWEEVRYMIEKCGFEILEEENIPARYASDSASMMKIVYDCVFLVARKKGSAYRQS